MHIDGPHHATVRQDVAVLAHGGVFNVNSIKLLGLNESAYSLSHGVTVTLRDGYRSQANHPEPAPDLSPHGVRQYDRFHSLTEICQVPGAVSFLTGTGEGEHCNLMF